MPRPKTNVTVAEFLAVLLAAPGAKIVSLATQTRPKLLVKSRATGEPTADRFPAGVERRAIGRFVLNFDYENNVNAQRLREGKADDFQAQGLWVSKAHPEGAGKADPEFPKFMVYHVDTLKRYLRARPHTNKQGRILKEHDQYVDLATGQPITGEALEDLKANYMPAKSPSKSQQLDKEVPVRCIEVDNCVGATYARHWYRFKH